VIHLIAEHFLDLSDLLRSVGDRDEPLRMRHGRGDEAKAGSREILQKGSEEEVRPGSQADLEPGTAPVLRVAARDFR
jgi:error-prone DNA polymerase